MEFKFKFFIVSTASSVSDPHGALWYVSRMNSVSPDCPLSDPKEAVLLGQLSQHRAHVIDGHIGGIHVFAGFSHAWRRTGGGTVRQQGGGTHDATLST